MKNKFKIVALFTLLMTSINCSKKSDLETYIEKSTELVSQVLSKKENSCSCLIASDETFLETIKKMYPELDAKKTIIHDLNLQANSDIENLIILSKNFQLKKEMVNSNVKILSKLKMDSIFGNNLKITREERDRIFKKTCPNGILRISKPIFNTDYKIAVFDIEDSSCLKDLNWTYRLNNNIWKTH